MRYPLLLSLLVCFQAIAQSPVYREAFPGVTFTAPVELLSPPDGSKRLFVVQQNGIVRVFPNKPGITPASVGNFLTISSRIVSGGERGLLGMAFHPNYQTNGYFYVLYTRPNPLTSVVSRFQVKSNNPNEADPDSELILLTQSQPFDNHNGGKLAFGPDGFLYISIGDGGGAGDPQNNAQNLTNLLGKILRIDVNSASGELKYSIPNTNPFANNTSGYRAEIFAYGLRNVWKFSIDHTTNTIWAADVGQGNREEINLISNGGNYGWRLMEGTLCYNPSTNCNPGNLILPIYEYPHTDNNRSVTGGYVYRGVQIPEWQGQYLYGDYISGRIWKLTYANNLAQNVFLNSAGGLISSFGEDHNREPYVVLYNTANSGRIFRYFPVPPATPSPITLKRLSGENELNWEDLSDNELGFIIERSPENDNTFTVLDSVGRNVTMYTDNLGDNATPYVYRIRSFNDGGVSDYALTQDIILGADDRITNLIQIYPQPASGPFTLVLPEEMLPARVSFLSLLGQVVTFQDVQEKETVFNLVTSSGIYLMMISSRHRTLQVKLILK